MSSATINAERRLRRRVSVCDTPHPREISDIVVLLRMIDGYRAREIGMLAIAQAQSPTPKEE